MSTLSRLTYNNINIDFDRALNKFQIAQARQFVENIMTTGKREVLFYYGADRVNISKRVLSRTFESQLAAFWEYVKSGQTFAFRWDRDLLAYMAFENLLATNDAVAGTLTRATTGTYVNPATGLVTTAASGAARHPAGKFGLGFLAEKAATNILLRSEEFDNAAWTATAITVTANTADTKDPAGGTAAEKLVLSAATGTLRQDTAVSIGTNHACLSVWLKLGTTGATAATLQIIRADTGAVLVSSAVTVTKSWQRFQVGYQSSGYIAANWGAILSFSGNTERFYVWGAQLEAGHRFATSYIATTSAAVTRNREQLIYSATSIFDDSPLTGSVCFWFAPLFSSTNNDADRHLFQLQSVLSTHFLIVKITSSGALTIEIENSGYGVFTASGSISGIIALNTFIHLAVTWDFNAAEGLKIYANGVEIDTTAISTNGPGRVGTSLLVGHSGTAGNESCGLIDDLEIRRDVLTAAEILARYNMAKPLGWRRNYWSSLMVDDDAYAPELLVGGYRWGMELNFVEQK